MLDPTEKSQTRGEIPSLHVTPRKSSTQYGSPVSGAKVWIKVCNMKCLIALDRLQSVKLFLTFSTAFPPVSDNMNPWVSRRNSAFSCITSHALSKSVELSYLTLILLPSQTSFRLVADLAAPSNQPEKRGLIMDHFFSGLKVGSVLQDDFFWDSSCRLARHHTRI